MFNGKKLLSLLIAVSFALQGCSRGVTPTQGDFNYVDAPLSGGQVTNSLCALVNDVDTDGDGNCDKDEEEMGTNKNLDERTTEEGPSRTWWQKNRWWALLGIGAVGTVAFVVARDKIATGDWWFNRPSDAQLNNANAGMYFLPTRDGNKAKIIKATTNEVFKYQDGVKHIIQFNELVHSGEGTAFNAGDVAVKAGTTLLSCFHGAEIGTQGTGADRTVSMYFKSVYLKKTVTTPNYLSRTGFENYCNNNTGMFLAVQLVGNPDSYTVEGIPSDLMKEFVDVPSSSQLQAAGYKKGISVGYNFNPSTLNATAGQRFYRYLPGHSGLTEENKKFQTIDYEYDSGANHLADFFGASSTNHDGTSMKFKVDLDPNEINASAGTYIDDNDPPE